MNRFLHIILLAVMVQSCADSKNMVTSNTTLKNMIETQHYTFIAQNAIPTEDSRLNPRLMLPQGSNLYQLTSRYDLKITPDSVIAYLPFFGRSFTAPLDPTKGGIQFVSTKFNYTKNIHKKNYEITITPQDAQDVRSIYLTISPSGYASARIISTNRTPISFNGIIDENQ